MKDILKAISDYGICPRGALIGTLIGLALVPFYGIQLGWLICLGPMLLSVYIINTMFKQWAEQIKGDNGDPPVFYFTSTFGGTFSGTFSSTFAGNQQRPSLAIE